MRTVIPILLALVGACMAAPPLPHRESPPLGSFTLWSGDECDGKPLLKDVPLTNSYKWDVTSAGYSATTNSVSFNAAPGWQMKITYLRFLPPLPFTVTPFGAGCVPNDHKTVTTIEITKFAKLWLESGPTIADVQQHSRSDCGFGAAMAAIALKDPAYLQSLYKGTLPQVTVNLYYKGTLESYTVDGFANSAEEGDTFSDVVPKTDMIIWPSTMERAMIQYAKKHTDLALPKDLQGIFPPAALVAWYGNKPGYVPFEKYLPLISTDEFIAILSTGKPVVFVSSPNASKYALPVYHGYTFVEYTQANNSVTIRNPWSIVSQAPIKPRVKVLDDGKFSMSLHDVVDCFPYIYSLH